MSLSSGQVPQIGEPVMAPLSWKGAGAVLAVGWFTWVLSVIAAVSDAWFIGSRLRAGTLDSYDRGYSLLEVKWRALFWTFTAVQFTATTLCSCAVVSLTGAAAIGCGASTGRCSSTKRLAAIARALFFASAFVQLAAFSLATSHFIFKWLRNGNGYGKFYVLLLGPTYAISLLAALLSLVDTALLRIHLRRLEEEPESPPRYPQPHLRQTNTFWVVFGVGLMAAVFQSASFANSVLAPEDYHLFPGLQVVPLLFSSTLLGLLVFAAGGPEQRPRIPRVEIMLGMWFLGFIFQVVAGVLASTPHLGTYFKGMVVLFICGAIPAFFLGHCITMLCILQRSLLFRLSLSPAAVAENGSCPRAGGVQLGGFPRSNLPQHGRRSAGFSTSAARGASYRPVGLMPQETASRSAPGNGPSLPYSSALQHTFDGEPAQ